MTAIQIRDIIPEPGVELDMEYVQTTANKHGLMVLECTNPERALEAAASMFSLRPVGETKMIQDGLGLYQCAWHYADTSEKKNKIAEEAISKFLSAWRFYSLEGDKWPILQDGFPRPAAPGTIYAPKLSADSTAPSLSEWRL